VEPTHCSPGWPPGPRSRQRAESLRRSCAGARTCTRSAGAHLPARLDVRRARRPGREAGRVAARRPRGRAAGRDARRVRRAARALARLRHRGLDLLCARREARPRGQARVPLSPLGVRARRPARGRPRDARRRGLRAERGPPAAGLARGLAGLHLRVSRSRRDAARAAPARAGEHARTGRHERLADRSDALLGRRRRELEGGARELRRVLPPWARTAPRCSRSGPRTRP
jgi:hypothetical protein